jgi:chromate transport protein ChrA
MQNIINWLLASLVFIASFTCYAMGNASGALILILAGFFFEVLLWLRSMKEQENNKRLF